MKQLFDEISYSSSRQITKKYSTSFSWAVRLLHSSIRQDIYNIYGFVRVADEIVDSFMGYPQEELFKNFEEDVWYSLSHGISANPVINAFQSTVKKYDISHKLIKSFLKSMRSDLTKKIYTNQQEISEYIYGSADVVGLMCLKIFVKGNEEEYERLKPSAVKLGSAFQKVNFLRDFKQDHEDLGRTYFPLIEPNNFNEASKKEIISEIREDFAIAKIGLLQLPKEARFGVYLAFQYYVRLLNKMDRAQVSIIKESRVRVSNISKIFLFVQSYFRCKFKFV